MELQWINEEPLYEYYAKKENDYFKWAFGKVISDFFEKYPTPKDWLESDKETIHYHCASELVYILYWVKECNVWDIKEYRQTIFDYFISKGRNNYFRTFCIKLGLMTEKDFEEIKSLSKAVKIQRVAMACILYRKNFKDITDDEIDEFLEFNKDKAITPVGASNLRIKLGVSNRKVLRRTPSPNLEYLFNHEKFGEVFSNYFKTLQVSSNKEYRKTTSIALKHLLDFMDDVGLEDFSTFDSSTFEELIEYLGIQKDISPSTIASYIPKITGFFKYNLKEKFFPKEFSFCTTFWSSYSRMSKKLSEESEGLSFSEASLAQKIVELLISFEPTNDIEFLCKNYWLIISSCPARMNYILNLGAKDALKPMPNAPNTFGIYSKLADKAGNEYGQFPILDKIGVDAIREIQEYNSKLNLKPIYNPRNNNTYVHLFQLPHEPWVLERNLVYGFFNEHILTKIKEHYDDTTEIRASAHSFRHYLLTHIVFTTGDVEIAKTAGGHRGQTQKMINQYTRSPASRKTLLFRVVDKYENQEITGKFYLKLVHLLTSPDTPLDEMLHAFSTEMKLDEFFLKYGKRTEAGYCFSKENCSKWYACWGCNNFIITRNEISQAINILSNQILELKNLQQCVDFSFDAPAIDNKMNLISLNYKKINRIGINRREH